MFRRGFTLIELLVVISIIALLASIVLAALNSARDKGRVGAGRYFGAQVDHTAGDYAVGLWDFDDGNVSAATDRSGLSNNAPYTGGPTYSPDTSNNRGSALLCNGSTQYALVTHTADFDVPYITVTAWAKTSSTGWRKVVGQGPDASEVFGLYVSPAGNLQVERQINGAQTGRGTNARISDGVWHHLAYSYDGTTETAYVDGTQVGKWTVSGTITSSAENISICAEKSSTTSTYFWNGLVDEIHFYAKAFTASQIRSMYAESFGRHPLAANE